MQEQRLIDLETKVAYQEMLIEELRQTTHDQYLLLERLEKALKQLTDRLQGRDDLNTAHEKPPHY